jgi:hypothetical protein
MLTDFCAEKRSSNLEAAAFPYCTNFANVLLSDRSRLGRGANE